MGIKTLQLPEESLCSIRIKKRLQKDIDVLLETLAKEGDLHVEIRNKQSVELKPFLKIETGLHTMDYKSCRTVKWNHMLTENFACLDQEILEICCGYMGDLVKAKR